MSTVGIMGSFPGGPEYVSIIEDSEERKYKKNIPKFREIHYFLTRTSHRLTIFSPKKLGFFALKQKSSPR